MIHVALDCGPPELDNGEINFNSTTFPSEANYTCDEGYYPSSFASTSTCEADGEWSELLCISKDCTLTSCPYAEHIASVHVGIIMFYSFRLCDTITST